MNKELEQIDWYRRCLEDIQDGRAVTGLQEAKLGYDAGMQSLLDRTAIYEDEEITERTAIYLLNAYRIRGGVEPVDSLAELSPEGREDWRRQARIDLWSIFGPK